MIDQRLAAHVRPHRTLALLTTVALCVTTALWWAQAAAMAIGLSALVRGDTTDFYLCAASVLACFVVRALIREVHMRLALQLGSRVRSDLRRHIVRSGLHRRHIHSREGRSGARTLAATESVEGVDAYVSQYIPHVLQVRVMPTTLVVALALTAPLVAAVVAFGLVVAVVGPRVWTRITAARGSTHSDTYEALSADLLESLRAMGMLRTTGAVQRRKQELDERSDALHQATVRTMRASLASTAVIDGGIQFGMVAAGLIAATIASGGNLPGGHGVWGNPSGFLLLMFASEAFRPVRDLAGHWHSGYLGLSAVAQLEKALDADPSDAAPTAHNGPTQPRAHEGAWQPSVDLVRATDVHFSWDGQPNTFAGLEYVWRRGELAGIAGESGVGKSTLVDLLSGLLQPDCGTITAVSNPAGSGPISRPLTTADVALVSQHPMLMAGTVRENLLTGAQVADDELRQALHRAAIDELSLDHVLGEAGNTISGGQRQRLAIARALVSNRPVLLLDEPTSALDERRCARVLQTLREEASRRVVILTTHRPDALAACEKVLHLRAKEPTHD